MSYPITFAVSQKVSDIPLNLQELLNLIANSLTATWPNPSGLILGQLGGILPESNVGPWANNAAWWFWNPATKSYARGAEGVPVGMIAIWGGQGAPDSWLICDGSSVQRATYPLLFQAIGTIWGANDGNTFNLPTGGGLFYMACETNFRVDPQTALTLVSSGSNPTGRKHGWGLQGGLQLAPLLTAANMPPLFTKVTYSSESKKQPGIAGLSVLQPASQAGAEAWTFQVEDANGQQLNVQLQTQFSIMPPFAAANFVIKYQ